MTSGSFTPHEDMNAQRIAWYRAWRSGMCPYCRAYFGPNQWEPGWHWRHEDCGAVREPWDLMDLPNVVTMCSTCGDFYPLGDRHDCPGEWIENY